MKFKSRIDITYLVFYLVNLIVGMAIITGLLSLRIDFLSIILSVVLALEIIIVSYMFFNCYYVICGDKIKLVIGFVSLEILISEIKAVTECKNLCFSFALSKLRLELKYGYSENKKRNKVYVSPKNVEGFIDALAGKV